MDGQAQEDGGADMNEYIATMVPWISIRIAIALAVVILVVVIYWIYDEKHGGGDNDDY